MFLEELRDLLAPLPQRPLPLSGFDSWLLVVLHEVLESVRIMNSAEMRTSEPSDHDTSNSYHDCRGLIERIDRNCRDIASIADG
jgi:hypothetical protein